MGTLLRLVPWTTNQDRRQVGRVHPDGSITFRGRTYRTLGEVPTGCRALRPDVATQREWRRLYRVIDPARRSRPESSRMPGGHNGP